MFAVFISIVFDLLIASFLKAIGHLLGDQHRVKADNLNLAGYILKPLTFPNFVEMMATLNK